MNKKFKINAIKIIIAVIALSGAIIALQASIEPQTKQIPLTIYLVEEDSNYYTSQRSLEEITHLVDNTNAIWMQAKITFTVQQIKRVNVSRYSIPNTINNNPEELKEHINEHTINLFLVKSLNNIYGLTIPGMNTVLLADKTRTKEERVLAHELGHVLGLKHVNDSSALMAQGEKGIILSESEVKKIRKTIKTLSS